MNQSLDVVSLVAGVVFVAAGVWLIGDAMASRPPLAIVVPVVGVVAVLCSVALAHRSRTWR